MKTESQIRQKLKQVLFRHRKEFLREQLQRRPENCMHNAVVHLPVHVSARASLRICGLVVEGDGWNNRVCDSLVGGDRQATQCHHYVCQHTPEDLKQQFNDKIGLGNTSVEIGRLAKDFPDAAALMWALSPSEEAPTVLSIFGEDGPEEDDDG